MAKVVGRSKAQTEAEAAAKVEVEVEADNRNQEGGDRRRSSGRSGRGAGLDVLTAAYGGGGGGEKGRGKGKGGEEYQDEESYLLHAMASSSSSSSSSSKRRQSSSSLLVPEEKEKGKIKEKELEAESKEETREVKRRKLTLLPPSSPYDDLDHGSGTIGSDRASSNAADAGTVASRGKGNPTAIDEAMSSPSSGIKRGAALGSGSKKSFNFQAAINELSDDNIFAPLVPYCVDSDSAGFSAFMRLLAPKIVAAAADADTANVTGGSAEAEKSEEEEDDEEEEEEDDVDHKPRRSSRTSETVTVPAGSKDKVDAAAAAAQALRVAAADEDARQLADLFSAVRMADGSVSDEWLVCRRASDLLRLERRIQDIIEFIEAVEVPADGTIPTDLCEQPMFIPVVNPAGAKRGSGAGDNSKERDATAGQLDRADVELMKLLVPPPRRYKDHKGNLLLEHRKFPPPPTHIHTRTHSAVRSFLLHTVHCAIYM